LIFAPTNPEKIASQQLYEAKRLLLEHQVAAEYHAAMVAMCKGRITRLSAPEPFAAQPAIDNFATAAIKE
jgi:hypothetical protein